VGKRVACILNQMGLGGVCIETRFEMRMNCDAAWLGEEVRCAVDWRRTKILYVAVQVGEDMAEASPDDCSISVWTAGNFASLSNPWQRELKLDWKALVSLPVGEVQREQKAVSVLPLVQQWSPARLLAV
jgi:hypothetical protein